MTARDRLIGKKQHISLHLTVARTDGGVEHAQTIHILVGDDHSEAVSELFHRFQHLGRQAAAQLQRLQRSRLPED